jgi:hypothetical protein
MAAILGPRVRPVAFVVLLAGIGVGIRPVAAQSLADVAKKEEERRKTVPAPAKVYTNKDLTAAPAGSTPAAPASAAATPAKAPDAADKAAKDKETKDGEPAKDQAYWAARLKTLRTKLERDTSFADALQTKVNSLSTDFVNRDDPAQRAVVERERQKALSELGRLKQDVAAGKKAIADLQEEARRAGVPPGWLR